MSSIILEKIFVENNRVDYLFRINGKIKKYFKSKNHMFLEYNYNIIEIPHSILVIPFISNIIPLIWITDSTLILKELDKSFFESLNKIKSAYQNMFPNVPFKGEVIVEKVVENFYTPEREAALLFSGGLDALTTYIRIREKRPLLITEYGWHENDIQSSSVWNEDKKNAIDFAKKHGLENILIQSNYGTFIIAESIDRDFRRKLGDTWWHGLHHSLAIISAAIPITYKLKVNYIYIASSYFKGYKKPCASDPTVDNEIKYGSGNVFHDGYELNRQDKVKVVVDYYLTKKEKLKLRVCFKNEVNCCNCEKCIRTILGIVAEGEDPRNFGFDIPENLSNHIKNFLKDNVKFFTTSNIMQWNLSKKRMNENWENILFKDLLNWYLEYNFENQRSKSLFTYRTTNFFPILKRKISTKIMRLFTQNS